MKQTVNVHVRHLEIGPPFIVHVYPSHFYPVSQQVACSRAECHFYHPPKPIRDQIVSRRHAQYLREKVLKLGSTNASLSASFAPNAKTNHVGHQPVHPSDSRLSLPANLQQNELTLPLLTQWNNTAFNVLLAHSLQANSRYPITSGEWSSVEPNPMNAPTTVPFTQPVTADNKLPGIESSDISNPNTATLKRYFNGVLLPNVPCTNPTFPPPTGPPYDPNTRQFNLPLMPYQTIYEPSKSLNLNLLNVLLNMQTQAAGIPPIAVNDYLQQTTNPTCPFQLDILYNLQQQVSFLWQRTSLLASGKRNTTSGFALCVLLLIGR
ncbi:hypothetical protein CSKR_200213 [Clonorchis sinensis]|uniref:C3H1-type domain-containing protein n=1 Tax=Clonorchis sinensis TaxID=79923 RepID=A0A8T1LYW2_CLOSI|nr:hypothetical protein CSKR_200213 [Clonorchis sinensis]